MVKVSVRVGTLYPASWTAATRASRVMEPRTVAFAVARFTVALATPGSDLIFFSTRPEQEAQDMPDTGMVSVVSLLFMAAL